MYLSIIKLVKIRTFVQWFLTKLGIYIKVSC